MAGPKNDASQTTMGAAALAVCIAQTLHELDARFLERLKTNAEAMYHHLADRNDAEAAKFVYVFGLALQDKDLFPKA